MWDFVAAEGTQRVGQGAPGADRGALPAAYTQAQGGGRLVKVSYVKA